MGIIPPLEKFHLSPEIQGIAAQSFYGGRAECRIRRTPVPVVHTDFKSQYPTVITLMGLSRLVVAKKLRITKATKDVRALLKRVTPDATFDPGFWPSLTCFALVQPEQDILPVRTAYDADSGENVGVNFLTSARPIWYALPDLIASKLSTGKSPKIIKALRVVGEGWQTGLQPTTLGDSEIDPRTGDFFKTVIEVRERIKRDTRLPVSEREALGYFLKIMANAGYGIFIETTPKSVAGRKPLTIFSGEFKFPTTSAVAEERGAWYCPLIASLVTSGGRLLLAMLERTVKDLGGSHLFADTDSMAIVSTKLGGLVACGGGLSRMPDGREAVTSLSWKEVTQIADQLNLLNPYDREAVPFILKIEDVNYENSVQRQLEGYAINAKRYTFFTRTVRNVRIITPSEHGLGHLFIPNSKFDKKQGAKDWVVEVWKYLVQTVLRQRTRRPGCFLLPAMMKLAVTTPDVLKVLQQRQLAKGTTYRERLKPFNFIQSPMINREVYAVGANAKQIIRLGYPSNADADHFTLISPFTEDSTSWYRISYINVHDGRQFYLAPLKAKQSFEASPYTIKDIVCRYHIHPESKSLAPAGTQCGWHTAGLLRRNSVVADGFGYIGKETDRKWEQEEDFSILFPTLPVYQPNESARLLGDFGVQNKIRTMSKREMARRTGLSTRTISAIRKGKRIRKSTAVIDGESDRPWSPNFT